MATESVQVFVRCRPMNDREKELKSKKCIRVDKKLLQIEIFKPTNAATEPKPFTFDGVYDDDSMQKQVYADTAFRLVQSVIEGYNATMFAYGQTGCGKTHTMEGKPNPPEMRGIIPNSFDHIFSAINSNTVKGKKFLVKASYIEIYNEEVRDLLGDDPKARCEVKENKDGTYIKGLSVIVVKDSNAIAQLMVNGNKNRSVGATLMNQTSSRSHSLFMVEVETAEPDEKTPDESKIRVGKLNLVDLAGSERQDKTKAEGDRLKEATQINKSLSALGNVIAALVRGKVHVPYRDSKLTRLLQSSLGGNTKTIMMAAISPAEDNYDETLSTLRYANRAKNIKNKPRINEDPKDALLREYQDEIKKLKAMLEAQAKGVPLQQLLDSQAAAAGASGDRRASVRLKKTTTAGAMVVDDDGRDADDFVDDDDVEGHAVIANASRRAGSASTHEAKMRKKAADEAAMRKAFEREKEWDETKSVVEALREALPKLQQDAAASEQAFKETKAQLDAAPKSPQPAGSAGEQAKTELQRRFDRLEAKSKNAATQYAAELDSFKKLDAADKGMSAVVKEQETTTTQRNQLASSLAGASGDAKRKEELNAQLKQLDAERDDQERRANAVAAQMKQERLEYRKVTDMYSALSRLAREKEEADRLEDERARMAAEMDRKRAEEVGREMARLAKEKAEHDAKVKALNEQMAADKSEKEKLVKLAAEKEKQEAIARELAEQMKREAESQQKAVLDAKLMKERIDEENKERARQTEELVKKIQEEKEVHEKARTDLADKIRKQKEKAREFQQQMVDEKKRSAMEKDSLTLKLKQLEDTMLEGDRKSKDQKLQQELALRHAQLVQQQKEAELQRARARADEEKADFESKVGDQKSTIARLKKKYKAALEEIKDITAEHDEEKEALNDLMRKVEREAQLRRQIISTFLTDKDYEKFVVQSKWDDAQGKWVLPSIEMAVVLPKIGGTLSEGLPGMKGHEDDVRDLRALSPHSKQRREYDAKWRQVARNRGRSVGIDHNGGGGNDLPTPGGGSSSSGYDARAGNRSAMHSRVGTASGTRGGGDGRDGLDSRSGTRGGNNYGANLGDDNGRGLSIVASRDAGRPPPAPHSAYIPRGNTGVAGQRKGSAGPRVDGGGGMGDDHEFDGAVGGGYRAPSPKSGPIDLNNLPQGRANFTPAKPPGPPPGSSHGAGGDDALLNNLPRPKPNFQPALGVPGGASAQNSAHNSAQNSEDDDEPVVARDGASSGTHASHAASAPAGRPNFQPAAGAGGNVVQVKPHMPDTHKRVFEPARLPTSSSHGNISGMAEHAHDPAAVDAALNATAALRKKPAFQPAASPGLGAAGNGGAVSDMELGKASAGFNAALNFQPKKASFQPAVVPAPDADGFGGGAAGGGYAGPKTPPRRHFQPAFGAAGGAGGGGGDNGAAHHDPFANIKAVPSKPAFQPAVFSG